MPIVVSVGIMAHNEEKNIGRLIESLLGQKQDSVKISEIIIVSSGSTDKTNQIIKRFKNKDQRFKLFIQKQRFGKAEAVNLFLEKAKEEIVILVSADLLLQKQTLEKLATPLKNKNVGIVGAHPIPVNSEDTFTGFAAHLLWNLHHRISLKTPKMGEMIAFRKIFKKIPTLSAVDEANIEPLIKGQGFRAVYAPEAIVYNKGPEKIGEFIARRRHIYAGHLATKYEYCYEVSTFNSVGILFLLVKNMQFSLRYILWTPAVIALEAYSRLLGLFDCKFKLKNHTIWEITKSTKDLGEARFKPKLY